MKDSKYIEIRIPRNYFLLIFTIFVFFSLYFITWMYKTSRATEAPTQKQGTFEFAFCPTPVVCSNTTTSGSQTPQQTSGGLQPASNPPAGGGPPPGSGPPAQTGGKSYCIDDAGPVPGNEPCDDASKFDIAKGAGGVFGTCGTVIAWAQTIMNAIQQGGGTWDAMPQSFTSCAYTSQTYPSGYLSTYVVIDSYNLAGHHELTKAAHTSAAAMQSFWQSAAGYVWIPYSGGSIQPIYSRITPGQAMFLGSHVGIVNSLEVDANGNGWISLLHSGTNYWLGVIIVSNWQVTNTPANYPLTGFGGRL